MSRYTSCEVCVEHFNPVPFDEDEGQNNEPIAFSKRPCEYPSCEEWRAGERYIIHSDNTIPLPPATHLEVCADCYLKFHGVFEE
tara:strand:- start:42080 stop:42331 length:252 start_codon:yes stop_codon:yes gene_type:complete